MIPKIIHYCWFGRGKKSEIINKCIDSWSKYCSDYKVIEWNEDKFDINSCNYTKEAYEAKKWAFISDVVRLYALANFGGIYMDTDVEVIKPLDALLKYHAVSGFETEMYVPTGLMAAEKDNIFIKELLSQYQSIHFKLPDGKLDTTTNVIRITNTCLKYGLKQNNKIQTINSLTLLPKDYLCPKDYTTGKINITNNTLTIHHFNGSWLSDEAMMARELLRNDYSKYYSEVLFPFVDVKVGAKIVVYGLGNFGKKIITDIREHEADYTLIACSDKKWKTYIEKEIPFYKTIDIIDPRRIMELDYDYVVITVLDSEVSSKILMELDNIGVPKSKVKLVDYRTTKLFLKNKHCV